MKIETLLGVEDTDKMIDAQAEVLEKHEELVNLCRKYNITMISSLGFYKKGYYWHSLVYDDKNEIEIKRIKLHVNHLFNYVKGDYEP